MQSSHLQYSRRCCCSAATQLPGLVRPVKASKTACSSSIEESQLLDQRSAPLLDAVLQRGDRLDDIPLHVPGHKVHHALSTTRFCEAAESVTQIDCTNDRRGSNNLIRCASSHHPTALQVMLVCTSADQQQQCKQQSQTYAWLTSTWKGLLPATPAVC